MLHPHLTTVVIPVADLATRIVAGCCVTVDRGPDGEPGGPSGPAAAEARLPRLAAGG